MATDVWGIDDGYTDVAGTWRPLGTASRSALRAAMGSDGDQPPTGPPLEFVVAGDTRRLPGRRELLLEDGTELGSVASLPPDLPIGWHQLRRPDGGPTTTLAVHPSRATLPPDLRAWLWSAQLYALRSSHSWGIGDFGDLAAFGRFARASGASLTLVNPVFDARTEPVCEASPYFPSSRRWLHPLWLRIEDIPGAHQLPDLPRLAAAGRALTSGPVIDRDRIWSLKRAALEQLWMLHRSAARTDPAFRRWREAEGDGLVDYARHRALTEAHGHDWRRWPTPLRDPTGPGATTAVTEPATADRVEFWTWVQWLLDRQLAAATAELQVMADLPVGVDPGGADSWRWQHVLAEGVRIGAPPDALGPLGQDWGVAPFIPWALRAAHYRPLVEVVRAVCARAAALRIDHVMGLFRLFWVPPEATPDAGGYVRFPGTELLDVVLLEAARTATLLVGEDLGTVEPGVRELLADRGVLGTRLVWFEDGLPAEYPESCMASVSTHDLPTVAGLLSGADAADVLAAGVPLDEAAAAAMRRRLLVAAASDRTTEVPSGEPVQPGPSTSGSPAGEPVPPGPSTSGSTAGEPVPPGPSTSGSTAGEPVPPGPSTSGSTAAQHRTGASPAPKVTGEPPTAEVIGDIVRALAGSPAALVALSLDDALGATARPNLPGTVATQRANWSLPLPVPLEDLAAHPLMQRCAATLRAARPRRPDANRPDANRPDANRPDANRPDADRPDRDGADPTLR
jgi:4-alpha-glucanotransferase